MKTTTSIYHIEVLERGKVKIVPHEPGTKTYEYLFRKQAVDFMKGLVASNPQWKFRLCKRTTNETKGSWQSFRK